ncbi:MAG: hypothetical protein MZW92_28830 [Comamonadaceae bacterium]|nr:hypothetical protein [Comamonadaceae bacterium]
MTTPARACAGGMRCAPGASVAHDRCLRQRRPRADPGPSPTTRSASSSRARWKRAEAGCATSWATRRGCGAARLPGARRR